MNVVASRFAPHHIVSGWYESPFDTLILSDSCEAITYNIA